MTTTLEHRDIGHTRQDRKWWVLVGLVAVCQAAGVIGIPFNERSIDSWYDGLAKPSFNPPSSVFGPVWTALYLLMAVAAWLVWRSTDRRRRGALWLFAGQLVLNAVWSPLFFGARKPGWALAEISVLWIAVVATTAVFWRIDRRAGALLAPYVAWVSFATALNFEIVRLN